MAFINHPTFKPAPSVDSKLWRYMGLPKFLSLLQTNSLFLCNLELLAKADPFEGIFPTSKFKHRQWTSINDVPDEIKVKLQQSVSIKKGLHYALENYKKNVELRIRQAYSYRKSYFINCWHMNENESSAMWDVYSKRNEGIAITSSEARFKKAFSEANLDIMGGVINYVDYANEHVEIDENNGLSVLLYKRNSFSYENEYRLVHWDTSVTHKQIYPKNGYFNMDGHLFPNLNNSKSVTVGRSDDEIEQINITAGLKLTCDLNKLIESIYVSPLAEEWFLDIIRNVSEKYNLNAKVIKSDLMAEPLR